jgi:hypothetical protein
MRGNCKVIGLSLFLFICFQPALKAQEKDILYKFIGIVSSQEVAIEEAEIRVFEDNEVLQTLYTDKKGKFEIVLLKGSVFTVEVSKSGFYTKRLVFSTVVENGVKKLAPLKFDVEMIDEAVYRTTEKENPEATSILDFPSVIFEYDSDLGDFNYREAYSKHILDEIKKIQP